LDEAKIMTFETIQHSCLQIMLARRNNW
jgi:hypothetical protein